MYSERIERNLMIFICGKETDGIRWRVKNSISSLHRAERSEGVVRAKILQITYVQLNVIYANTVEREYYKQK